MLFPSSTQNPSRKHALVAEDSLLHQRLATALLTQHGFQVIVAKNGQEAVAAARHFSFDLILMDIEMPVLDGCAATRQIRDWEPKQGLHVPIVAVTSLDEREHVLSAGMDAYIAKPLSASALDEVLRELIAEPTSC